MAEASPDVGAQPHRPISEEPVTLLAQTVNTLAEKMGTLVDAVGSITQATRNTQDEVARIGREVRHLADGRMVAFDERLTAFDERLTVIEGRANTDPPNFEGRQSQKRVAVGCENASRKRRTISRNAKSKGKTAAHNPNVDEGQGTGSVSGEAEVNVTGPSPIMGTFHQRLGFTNVIVPQPVKSKVTTYVRETWQELEGRRAFLSKAKGTWMLAEAGWSDFIRDLGSVYSFSVADGILVCSKK